MKAFIRTLAVALAAVLAIGSPGLAQTFTVRDGESVMMTVAEEASVGNESSLGYWNQGPTKNKPGQAILPCVSTKDPACDFNDPNFDVDTRSVFPQCTANTDVACIESLELAVEGGVLAPATFLREATGGKKIPADPAMNFLYSGSPSIYEMPGVPNAGGTNNYAVVLKGRQSLDKKSKKWTLTSINAVVIPYVDARDSKYGVVGADGNGGGNTNECAYYESGVCGKAVDFTEGTQVRIKFRIPKTVGGWFLGRIKAPNIDVQSYSSKANQITVGGQSVVVARLKHPMTSEELKLPKNEWLTHLSNWGAEGMNAAGYGASEKDVFKFVDFIRPLVNDSATSVNSYWDISSTNGGQGSRCLSDTSKVLGIVSTNATGYDGSSPSFVGGFLNYKVTGLHYLPGGKELSLGTYDLIMRSDTARCLYGFSKAPLSATVSVTGGTGGKNVATTVVSEKNGWLKMAAYGFTFSKKTIKVKITKKKK